MMQNNALQALERIYMLDAYEAYYMHPNGRTITLWCSHGRVDVLISALVCPSEPIKAPERVIFALNSIEDTAIIAA